MQRDNNDTILDMTNAAGIATKHSPDIETATAALLSEVFGDDKGGALVSGEDFLNRQISSIFEQLRRDAVDQGWMGRLFGHTIRKLKAVSKPVEEADTQLRAEECYISLDVTEDQARHSAGGSAVHAQEEAQPQSEEEEGGFSQFARWAMPNSAEDAGDSKIKTYDTKTTVSYAQVIKLTTLFSVSDNKPVSVTVGEGSYSDLEPSRADQDA